MFKFAPDVFDVILCQNDTTFFELPKILLYRGFRPPCHFLEIRKIQLKSLVCVYSYSFYTISKYFDVFRYIPPLAKFLKLKFYHTSTI